MASPGIAVLIADSFCPFRCSLRRKLHENGFLTIVEAVDGLEAVTKAAELQPDLVLLDIAMPKLNGIEAAARIRTVDSHSKIIFVSQNTDPDVVESALSDGAKGYIYKSEINHDLLPAIDAVLGGKRFVSREFQLFVGYLKSRDVATL
jgi:response regulator NasT